MPAEKRERNADIIAVEGDPLSDVGALTHGVRWVMKGGRVVVDKTGSQPLRPGAGETP